MYLDFKLYNISIYVSNKEEHSISKACILLPQFLPQFRDRLSII